MRLMHSCYPIRIGFAVHRCNWEENVCVTQCNKQYHFSRNLILTVSEFSSRIRACSKLTPRQLRNWVSIFLFARGMHFPLCNLKEWTSVIYKVWADVARYNAATKSRHQTTVRSSAHQIFNKSKMHGIRQTRLTALSHTITSCHVNIHYVCPHNATLVSMRRWVFAEWTHRLESPSRKMDTSEECARGLAARKLYLPDAINFLMNCIFKCYYSRFSDVNDITRHYIVSRNSHFLLTKFARIIAMRS